MKAVTIERYGNAGKRIYNEDYFFRSGYTYSYMARGSLGVRLMTAAIFGHKSPAIFALNKHTIVSTIANCRVTSLMGRAISASIQLPEGCVARIPYAQINSVDLPALESSCVILKRWLVSNDLTERSFYNKETACGSLIAACRLSALETNAIAAMLHMLEGFSEKLVFDAYSLDSDDTATVLAETGTPVGWFPLIQGYDQGLEVGSWDFRNGEAHVVTALQEKALQSIGRLVFSAQELQDFKRRLYLFYEESPSQREGNDEAELSAAEMEEEGDDAAGAQIFIPTETFLEELSQKLEVHPLSIYRLIEEGIEKEGWRRHPEEERSTADCFSVIILQLLGHCWPRQTESGKQEPEWADPDGIIPLTDGTGQRTLLDRVRERIATDFGEACVDAIEQEFRQIMGRSLADWLARDFFPHHISQFKRRPIAWLLESGRAVDTRWETTRSRRGRRSARSGGPAFACLVYYHKLTADSLTRIKTHYLRPVLQRREFELAEERRRVAEGNTAARASAERLAEVVDELNAFEAALDTVSTQGFSSRHLVDLLNKEKPDSWTRRTPHSPISDKEAFMHQEQAYDPDINDGVRVNIAPLQKYGLLAADVLAQKDVVRAIDDRAAWRADERRWCREGKLPKPGWWQDRD